MTQTIHIKMLEQKIELDLPENIITKTSIKSAFLLSEDSKVSLTYEVDGRKKYCRMTVDGKSFLLPDDWTTLMFVVQTDKTPSRPSTPPQGIPPPIPYIIDEWMFYSKETTGKATVVCVHPRYFVTFRHGAHLLLEVGSKMKIFHAKEDDDANPEKGIDVVVVDIRERRDFILLKSEESIVEKGPRLVAINARERFLFAGFEDGCQELAYLNGIVDPWKDCHINFSLKNRPNVPMMGTASFGSGESSRGYPDGACWSYRGLIGLNYGVTFMSDFQFSHLPTSESDTLTPKYIISNGIFIDQALATQLHKEKQGSSKSPSEQEKLTETSVEGTGS